MITRQINTMKENNTRRKMKIPTEEKKAAHAALPSTSIPQPASLLHDARSLRMTRTVIWKKTVQLLLFLLHLLLILLCFLLSLGPFFYVAIPLFTCSFSAYLFSSSSSSSSPSSSLSSSIFFLCYILLSFFFLFHLLILYSNT